MHPVFFWAWLIERNQNVYGILGLVVSVAGFWLAYLALRKGNINSSAALSLTISEIYSNAWAKYLDAKTPAIEKYELGELLNALESGATLFHEGTFVGLARKLQEKAIKNAIKVLSKDAQNLKNARDLLNEKTTFIELRKFCKKRGVELFPVVLGEGG